jgi:MoxR-like ATPase
MSETEDGPHSAKARGSASMKALIAEIGKVVVGQKYLIERLLVGLLSDGHVLIEGVPGLAKTLSVKVLSQAIGTSFQRIQFTPDLLPADLLGTLIYDPKEATFVTRKGPLFANIILADEINRAPAKVQSALLEAMQERQITLGDRSYPLEDPFIVFATQNPLEQEWTYPLPEAQIDRFMLKTKVTFPTREEESLIMQRMARTDGTVTVDSVLTPQEIRVARRAAGEVYLDDKITRYILDLVFATRKPEEYGLTDLRALIRHGASPRASIYLSLASRAYAFLQGRGYVTPQDVKSIGRDVLRHRVIPSYEAEAEEVTSDDLLTRIFERIEVP